MDTRDIYKLARTYQTNMNATKETTKEEGKIKPTTAENKILEKTKITHRHWDISHPRRSSCVPPPPYHSRSKMWRKKMVSIPLNACVYTHSTKLGQIYILRRIWTSPIDVFSMETILPLHSYSRQSHQRHVETITSHSCPYLHKTSHSNFVIIFLYRFIRIHCSQFLSFS